MKNAIALIALSSLLISGCGKETDADKIADAQACLDTATPANVSDCVDKVSGVSGKGAELIRCVAVYVKQEKTAAEVLSALFSKLDSTGDAGDNLLAGIEEIVFQKSTSPAENKSDANSAATHCSASNSPGLSMLSTLTLTATVISGGQSAGDVVTRIGTCVGGSCSDDDKELIGTAVQLAYQQNCTGGAESGGDLCEQMNTVIAAGGGDPTAIGDKLLLCMGPTPPGDCTGF